MLWLWMGLGAAIVIAAISLSVLITTFIDRRMDAKQRTIRQHHTGADTAMVQTIQNTIAEMFDAVRRQR